MGAFLNCYDIFCARSLVFSLHNDLFELQFLYTRILKGHKMSRYLLEIGTEELPYKFIVQAINQLKEIFENFLDNNKIKYDVVEVLATPRRLAVILNGLSDRQPDDEKIVKGPIKNIAYDEEGNLTKAGLGFGNKFGVTANNLFLKDNYLHAKIFSKGKLTSEILQENVPQLVLKLQGSHFMRWASYDEKFSRPIRWIVSLLDNRQIPIEIIGVKSSKISRGHRFSERNIEISNSVEYVEKLRKAHVIVDQNERKKIIVDSSKRTADKFDAEVRYNDDLLDEVTFLTEYPIPVICDFDEKYLNIPENVTVTVMASHQRYFALYKDNELLNKFITIANYVGDDFSNIKAGNERVIVARLDDAIFFFNEDTKKPFDNYVDALKGITFQKGMGSVYDKTQRIIKLSKIISDRLGEKSPTIERTALLCKADLTTSLVFEFTELQGFIGADYAKNSGEDSRVAQGIKEHYFPLSSESELAEGIEGQIVGIADKIDTICAVFVDGKKPTGSSDPLGVRRAALGIIKTIITKYLNIDLSDLIKSSVDLLPIKSDVTNQIEEFFIQRLIIFLSENYRKDVLEACIKNKNPLTDLCDFVQRVRFLSELINFSDFNRLAESSNRISRILKNDFDGQVNPSLFTCDAEINLYESIKHIKDTTYELLFAGLKETNIYVEKFFEDVLVMDENESIKNNRLTMLSMLNKKYKLIADFSALQI